MIGDLSIAEAVKDDIAVRAYADKRSILIGDRIKYTIEVRAGKGTIIGFPRFKEARIGDFEIKDSGTRTKTRPFARQISSNWYYLTTYSVGKHIIPEVEIGFRRGRETEWRTKKTAPINIRVEGTLPKTGPAQDIKDIKGPIYLFEVNWVYGLAALAILLAIGLFALYLRRRKKIPLRLPHERALEELESVKGMLARTGDIKGYYIGISDCIRCYIERAFGLRAPEMTTEEFLNSLKASPALSLDQKELLKDFLNACDLVKFARHTPSRDEIESVFVTAKTFVEETKDVYAQDEEEGI